jgi:hypothetical protein
VPGGGGGPATADRGPEPDFVRERSRYVNGRVRSRCVFHACSCVRVCVG